MVSRPRLLALFALFAAAASLGRAAINSDLWRPRFATPAIVALDSTKDREFVIEQRAPRTATGWTASLANEFKTWPCEVVSATYGKINRDTEPGWRIVARVPADISPELFDLTVADNGGTSTQNQAVSVCASFTDDFYILHITDEQIVNKTHTDPSGQYHKGVGTWDGMEWMQEPVNLIHPRFVFATGDQIDFNGALDGWNHWDNFGYGPIGKHTFKPSQVLAIEERLGDMYKDCHRGYTVPYVETPGNHDVMPPGKKLFGSHVEWWPISIQIYEEEFGQRSYSFRMGDFYVLMHDWSDPQLLKWTQHEYAQALADPTITYRLIGQHFPFKWDGAPTGNYPFVTDKCDLMLVGHGHHIKTMQTSPFYIYMDGPAFSFGKTGFFNFRRTKTGWSCDQTVHPRNPETDMWELYTKNGAVKKVRCDPSDPTHVTTRTVTISNDLPQRFYDGRVRFVLPAGHYTAIHNGTILSEYGSRDGKDTIVVVKVDIPASGKITVSLGDPTGSSSTSAAEPRRSASPVAAVADRGHRL